MSELSPQAQAVLASYKEARDGNYIDGEWIQDEAGQVAAALRAAVDQVAPSDPNMPERWEVKDEIRADLLAIADELENHQ